jgi:hypothetical protein
VDAPSSLTPQRCTYFSHLYMLEESNTSGLVKWTRASFIELQCLISRDRSRNGSNVLEA